MQTYICEKLGKGEGAQGKGNNIRSVPETLSKSGHNASLVRDVKAHIAGYFCKQVKER